MALKQDYVLRLIEEIINLLVRSDKKKEDILEFFEDSDGKDKEKLEYLKKLIDEKKINEAEDYLFENLDKSNHDDFLIGMLFYKYLNLKDDSFFEDINYERNEITDGIADLSKMYGYGDFVEMLFKT